MARDSRSIPPPIRPPRAGQVVSRSRLRTALPAAAALTAAGLTLGGCGMLQWLGLDDIGGPAKQVAQAEPAAGGDPAAAEGLRLDPEVLNALRGRPAAPPAESLPTPVRPPEPPPRRGAVEAVPIVPPSDAPPTASGAPGIPEIADPGGTRPERPGLPPTDEAPSAPETPPRPADRPAAPPPRAPEAAEAPAEPLPAPEPEILSERPPPETPTAEAPPEGRRIDDPPPPAPAPPPADEETVQPEPAPDAAAEQAEPAEETAPPPPDEQPQLAARPPEPEQLPPPGESVATLPEGDGFRITFEPQSEELTDAAGRLLVGLVERLKSNEDMRLQIRAYAGGTPESASQARRLSLARALRIRTFLIDRGIRSTRIDLRALGNTAPQPPADRVDLLLSS